MIGGMNEARQTKPGKEEVGTSLSTAAVVISFNSAEDLPVCLEALKSARALDSILVVDNASSDDSVEIALSFGVDVLESSRNSGFAGGCNAGFCRLGPGVDMAAFLNPDVRVEPDVFEHCRRSFREDPRVGAVAPLLLRPGLKIIDSAGQCLRPQSLEVEDRGYGRPLDDFPLSARPVLAACGALAVYRMQALGDAVDEHEGPWADSYFCFWEDLELGWRLNNLGWKTVFEPAARAVHIRGGGAAPGRGPLRWRRPPDLEACILSNRWMTLLRHLHSRDFLRHLPFLLLRDPLLAGAGILRRPVLLRHLIRRWPLIRRELKMRGGRPRRRLEELPC